MANKQTKRARREAAARARRRQQRIRWGSALGVAVLATLAIVISAGGGTNQAGALAQDFELESPDGEIVRLSDYRGQPVAVTFMHTY